VDGTVRHLGRVDLVRDKLIAFAKQLDMSLSKTPKNLTLHLAHVVSATQRNPGQSWLPR
jgi:hypothetical protein